MTRKTLIATLILAPILIVLLLLGGAYGFLQTDSGRALLVFQIEEAVNDPDGLMIEDDEGWAWVVGPEFGCVHFAPKERPGNEKV